MKTRLVVFTLFLTAVLISSCEKKVVPAPSPPSTSTDTVTTASIVDTEEAFMKAIANDGTWIIATLRDLTTDKELLLGGNFKNGKGDTQRKIALYEQDADRNITTRHSLTAPKLTIASPMASIQHGTFNGDLEVLAPNFELIDTKINGNIYFSNDEALSSFKMDGDSSVSGEQKLK